MGDTDSFRNQVITNLRACLISSQEGVPARCLNSDYKQLIGEPIPFGKLGFNTLEAFLGSVPDLTLKTVNGVTLVEAKKSDTSNHISKLVQSQKRNGRRKRGKSKPVKSQAKSSLQSPMVRRPKSNDRVNMNSSKVDRSRPRIRNANERDDRRENLRRENPRTENISNRPRPLLPSPFSHSTPKFSVPRQRPPNHPAIPPLLNSYGPPRMQSYNSNRYPLQHQEIVPPPLLQNINSALILKQQAIDLCRHINQAPFPNDPSPIYRPVEHNDPSPIYRPERPVEHNDRPVRPVEHNDPSPIHRRVRSVEEERTQLNAQKEELQIEVLPIILSLDQDSYYHKLSNLIKEKGLPAPQVVINRMRRNGFVACAVTLRYDKTESEALKVQEFSSFPMEIVNPKEALECGAKKAYEWLQETTAVKYSPTRDAKMILARIIEIVKDRKHGIWSYKIEEDYVNKYRESLPPKWINIIKDSKMLTAEYAGHSFLVKPFQDEEGISMVSLCYKRSLVIPQLTPPESDEWDVYVTKVNSLSQLWIILIGEDHSTQLANLMNEMEMYYLHDKQSPVTIVEIESYYVAIWENSVYRVIVKERFETEALVQFIDFGGDEIVPLNDIRPLRPQFSLLPGQAIQVNLSGLEYTSNFDDDVEVDGIIEIPCKALIKKRSPIEIVLYDTSGNYDIDINNMIISSICSEELHQPTHLEIGSIIEIRISHIDEFSGNIFIQLANSTVLSYLEERLTTVVEKENRIIKWSNLNSNKIYFINLKGKVHRVIISPSNDFSTTLVQAKLIDIGKIITVSRSHLFEIVDNYNIICNIPPQALRIILKDIPELTESKIKNLRSIAPSDTPVIAKVVDKTDYPVLDLFVRNQTEQSLVSVNNTLELEGLLGMFDTSLNFEHSTYNQISSLSTISLDNSQLSNCTIEDKDIFQWNGEGSDIFGAHTVETPPIGEDYFEIYVAEAANPSHFTVQPLKYLAELNKMTQSMKLFYDKIKSNIVSPFQYIVYAVESSDGYWYRGCVYRVINDEVTIKMCDYGNLEVVPLSRLRPLHKQFMKLPFLGFRAKLAGIEPTHGDWDADNCLSFQNMVEGKKMISIIRKVNYSEDDMPTLSLDLIDTSSELDINISHHLVLNGLAKYA